METKLYVSRVLLGAASGLALAIASSSLAVAQQKGSQQQPQQKQQQQSGQPSQMLQQSINSLEQVRQQIEQAQSNQLKQVTQRAMDPMKRMENALKQAGDQAQTQPAMDSLKTARAALQEQRPDKQLIVQAIDDVIEDAKRVHQNMAQAQPQGSQNAADRQRSASSGDRQDSASGGDRTASAGQDRSADIQVQQKAPNITVTQQPPDVVVKQPAPQVTVQQPRPDVTVKSAEPNVSVKQAGRPEVTVERKGEPEVSVQDQQRQAQANPGTQPRDQGTTQRDSTMAPPGTTGTTAQSDSSADNRIVTMGREIVGKEIYGANNANIGEVEDVVIASGSNRIEAVLVDVGGFLGIGERRVAIPIDSLQMQGSDRITTTMTDAQVRDLPEHQDQATR